MTIPQISTLNGELEAIISIIQNITEKFSESDIAQAYHKVKNETAELDLGIPELKERILEKLYQKKKSSPQKATPTNSMLNEVLASIESPKKND